MPSTPKKPMRLLSRRQLLERVSLSYVTIWKRMQTGDFPRSRQVGGKCVWLESEIDEWIDNLPLVRLRGDADPPTVPLTPVTSTSMRVEAVRPAKGRRAAAASVASPNRKKTQKKLGSKPAKARAEARA